jgi:hypothetical protein
MKFFGIKYILFLGLGITLLSCNRSDVSFNGDFVGSIESKSNVGDLSAEEYDETWLPVTQRKELLDDLLLKVKNKQLKVYSFMPGELTPMTNSEIDYVFYHVDTEYVEDEFGEIKPIPIEETYDQSGIVFLKFKESLFYDKGTGRFQKKVNYVCPMEKVYNEDGTTRGYRGLFWIELE